MMMREALETLPPKVKISDPSHYTSPENVCKWVDKLKMFSTKYLVEILLLK